MIHCLLLVLVHLGFTLTYYKQTKSCKHKVSWIDRQVIHWTVLVTYSASSALYQPVVKDQNIFFFL